MEYVDRGVSFVLKCLVGLEGNEDAVADTVVFKNELGRGELDDGSFDIVNHVSWRVPVTRFAKIP